MTRTAAYTALGLALADILGCSPPRTDAQLQIVGPTDTGCLGVVGFEIDVLTHEQRHYTQLRSAPVLEPNQCRLDPLAASDIEADVPITVAVDGYDSQHKQLVHVSAPIGELRALSAEALSLQSVGNAGPVLVINRTTLLDGASVQDVVSMEVTAGPPKQNTLLRLVVSDVARPFFDHGDPGAFVLDASVTLDDIEKVSVTFDTGTGPVQTPQGKLQLARQSGGTIWLLQPAK